MRAIAISAGLALASSISLAAGLPVAADTYITSAAASANFGSSGSLAVGSGATALLNFDVSVLPTGLVGAAILKANLTVYVGRIQTAGSIDVLQVNTPWTESAITFANQPQTTPLGVTVAVPPTGGYLTFDVTPLVARWIDNATPRYGIALSPSLSTPTASFLLDSKESATTSHPATLELIVNQYIGPPGPQGPTGPKGVDGAPGSAAVDLQTVCAALGFPNVTECQFWLSSSRPYRLVFLTSSLYDGNMGGLTGADQKCQTEAQQAGLLGSYKAWLSSSSASPSSRFTQSGLPYRLPNTARTLIADSFSYLTTQGPRSAIIVDAKGASQNTSSVWTGTSPSGTLASPTCSDWTVNGTLTLGTGGSTNPGSWTQGTRSSCSGLGRLYCFEQ